MVRQVCEELNIQESECAKNASEESRVAGEVFVYMAIRCSRYCAVQIT